MLTAFGGKLGEVIRIRGGYQNAASMVALVALRAETRAGMLAVSHLMMLKQVQHHAFRLHVNV